MLRTVIVMDYQNVHLTAHDIFNRQSSKHYALIHPMQFAETAIRRRNELQREGYPHAVLKKVMVFRGLPHVDYDWEQHRRCTAQADQWRRDGTIVELRDLKYSFQMTATGLPATDANHRKIPIGPGVEKGIDVLVALTCLREALRHDVDLVIMASRDTDLVPTLDTVFDMRTEDSTVARIETVSWFDKEAARQGRFAGGNLRPTRPRRIWNTNLDRSSFEASRDRNDYT